MTLSFRKPSGPPKHSCPGANIPIGKSRNVLSMMTYGLYAFLIYGVSDN